MLGHFVHDVLVRYTHMVKSFFLFFFISFLFVLSCIDNSQSVLIRIIIER